MNYKKLIEKMVEQMEDESMLRGTYLILIVMLRG